MEENMNFSFCVDADELKKGRSKSVHAQGVHAKVRWEPIAANIKKHGYTGMFESGSKSVIMRLSET